MIQVVVGTNTNRNTVVVAEDTSIKEVLESNGVNYAVATTHLDGAPLSAEEMNMTFEELGVTEKCYLVNVIKADNAI